MGNFPAGKTAQLSRSFPSSAAVVIPAWQPQQELVTLVRSIQEHGCKALLVVDDGSRAECQPIFSQLQSLPSVTVLRHSQNCGKGCALKTAFRHFLSDLPECSGVITADADGQHAAGDIARVAKAQAEHPAAVILGCRRLTSEMPLRSRFGNTLTRHIFRSVTGVNLSDTQTGLRAFPREMIGELLSIDGERYEYEIAVLLHCCQSGRTLTEVPIRAIYHEGNRSSHFRSVKDSIQIYKVIARYIFSRPN